MGIVFPLILRHEGFAWPSLLEQCDGLRAFSACFGPFSVFLVRKSSHCYWGEGLVPHVGVIRRHDCTPRVHDFAPSVAIRVWGGRLGRGNRARGFTGLHLGWRLGGVWVALMGVIVVEGARLCSFDGGPTTTREQCDGLRTFFDDFGPFSGDFCP